MAEKKITTYEQRSEHEIPYLPPGKDIKGVSVQNHDCTKCGRASFLGCLVGCEQNRDEVPSLSLILVHSVIYLVNGQIKSHFFNRCRFCWSTATFGCCDRTNPRCYTGFSAKEDWSKYESFRVRGITYVDKEDPWYERLSGKTLLRILLLFSISFVDHSSCHRQSKK